MEQLSSSKVMEAVNHLKNSAMKADTISKRAEFEKPYELGNFLKMEV